MRWLFWLRRSTPPEVKITIDEAIEAVETEKKRLVRSERDAAAARNVTRALRNLRTENHFADLMHGARKL